MIMRGEFKRQPSIFSKGSKVQAPTSGNTALSGCTRWLLNAIRTGLLTLVSYSQLREFQLTLFPD